MADRAPIIRFVDSRRRTKHLILTVGGRYRHTGNSNYILVGGSPGKVIYYPAAKVVRRIMHNTR